MTKSNKDMLTGLFLMGMLVVTVVGFGYFLYSEAQPSGGRIIILNEGSE